MSDDINEDRILDLIEAALIVRWIEVDGDVKTMRDIRPGKLTVTFPDGTEADITVKLVRPGEAVSIDETMAQPVEKASIGSTEPPPPEVGIDPEVSRNRERIDSSIPQNRWSWRAESDTDAEVVAPDGHAYAVMTEQIAQDLAAEINRSLFEVVSDAS